MALGSTANVAGIATIPLDCTISGPTPYFVSFASLPPNPNATALPVLRPTVLTTQVITAPLGASITVPATTNSYQSMPAALQVAIQAAASAANVGPAVAQFLGWVAFLDYVRNGGT